MQALRYHGRGVLKLDEIPIPQCGKGQVKVRPAYTGICGSDLHEYLSGPITTPSKPHSITGETIPVTLGHEFSGTIEEVGEGVADIEVGTHVTVQPIIYDGTCDSCKAGRPNCCDQIGIVGLSGWGGGLTEHVVLPRESVFAVPDSIPLDIAALVEPLAVGWHAVSLSSFDPTTDSVLVLGGGPIGLAVIQCLVARGARTIIVSEPSTQRKAFAKQFGAHHVLNPLVDDVPSKVRELTGGSGVHVAYDAAGVQAGLDGAIGALRAGGLMVNIAMWTRPASFNATAFAFREKRYMGIVTYFPGDFQAVIDAIASGQIKPAPMITRVIGLDEVEEKGFKALINDKDNQVKILIKVQP